MIINNRFMDVGWGEFEGYGGDNFVGVTPSCSCCSSNSHILEIHIEQELRELAAVYREMADRYLMRAEVIAHYGPGRVAAALRVRNFKYESEENERAHAAMDRENAKILAAWFGEGKSLFDTN